MAEWRDSDFYSEHDAARTRGLNPMSHMLLMFVFLFFAAALVWAWRASVDEVTVGEGQVIPSGKIQVVQNLEGGIVSELLVKKGEMVARGMVLLRIDDTQAQASFRENRARYLALLARVARLQAEAEDKPFQPPPEVVRERPDQAASENDLYLNRRNSLAAAIEIIQKQVAQKEQELVELSATKKQISRRLELARKEMHITAPMVKQGVMSQVELLRLEREVAELEGALENATLSIPRVQSVLEETRRKADEPRLEFRSQTLAALNEARGELAGMQESSTALEDRVTRTAVRSPVRGTVIRLLVNTIGQVVRPGMDLVEIMPLEDNLLIEARIRPADIAFLRPGLPTLVKFTAYDFAIYGGLPGELAHISPDTITDSSGESYYQIQVRTGKSHLGTPENPLPIIPGMVAMVDIITGRKTVLDYLLKPILKARANALRER
ncbi:MAG: HlyD family type I secretion periplasmic adaptor subunit [Magnetococcales bacterium]|nr:HlyD family type I secretion periplasmic adaptor subunit [Magnetococcales bacterium]